MIKESNLQGNNPSRSLVSIQSRSLLGLAPFFFHSDAGRYNEAHLPPCPTSALKVHKADEQEFPFPLEDRDWFKVVHILTQYKPIRALPPATETHIVRDVRLALNVAPNEENGSKIENNSEKKQSLPKILGPSICPRTVRLHKLSWNSLL